MLTSRDFLCDFSCFFVPLKNVCHFVLGEKEFRNCGPSHYSLCPWSGLNLSISSKQIKKKAPEGKQIFFKKYFKTFLQISLKRREVTFKKEFWMYISVSFVFLCDQARAGEELLPYLEES